MQKTKANDLGFSLLELIVTVAVLSLGIVIILQSFSFCSRAAGFSGDMTSALFLSQDKLQELEFKESIFGIKNEPSGVIKEQGRFEYSYSLEFMPGCGLYLVDFGVFWTRQLAPKEIRIRTYLR